MHTFGLCLALAAYGAASRARRGGAQLGEGRMGAGRILLAEDVAANVLMFRAVLESAGYQVVVAEDGATAAEKAVTHPFELILMDLGLPKISGLEATMRIRAASVMTPIVALSAEDDPIAERACKEAGMNGFLAKPISPADLLRAAATAAAAVA